MKVSKVNHKSKWRIRIDFPYDRSLADKVKTIHDAAWSKSMQAWHIPYTNEAFAKLKELFPDLEYSKPEQSGSYVLSLKQQKIANVVARSSSSDTILIELSGKQISIKMPKNEVDIQFIRSFKYFRWNKNTYCWLIPNYRDNLDKLKAYFGNRKIEIIEHSSTIQSVDTIQPIYNKDQMLVICSSRRKLRLYFSYNKDMAARIRQIPLSSWNNDMTCWELPYSERYLTEIKDLTQQHSLEWEYREENKDKIIPRKSRLDIKHYKTCPTEYLEKLKELRYSQHTINSYTDLFEEFINHYEDCQPEEITEPMIIDFLRYLVNVRKISSSYQNQSINAIHPVGFKIKVMYYYVYVLLSEKDGDFYTGYTSDLKRRLQEHIEGKVYSTKTRLPVRLIYFEGCLNQQDATRREKYLKSGSGKIYLRNRLSNHITNPTG